MSGRAERHLREISARLRGLRAELAVADEQLLALDDDADDARLRSLVSDSPVDDREHRDASRQAEAMRRHRKRTAAEIARLEAEQDHWLDRLTGDT